MGQTPLNSHVEEGLSRPERAHDVRLFADFTSWYCKAHHTDRLKREIALSSQVAGEYARWSLCDECASFIRYAEKRTALCKQEPKPFCAHCSIKCYAPSMREYSRQVMRYAGPRSIFSRHALSAIKHLIESKKSVDSSK